MEACWRGELQGNERMRDHYREFQLSTASHQMLLLTRNSICWRTV
jgi:hypothetical protein